MKKAILLTMLMLSACAPLATPAPTATSTPLPTEAPTATIEPTSTDTPEPTATFTASPVPTSTPGFPKLLFEEDFATDKLGWNSQKMVVGYGDGKLSFDYPKSTDEKQKYYGSWTIPKKPLSIKGDAMVQVTFDRPVWFSGVFFQKAGSSRFALIAGCGENLENWKSNTCTLGLLQPAEKEPWETVNDNITASIRRTEGVITFNILFEGEKMTVYINGDLATTQTGAQYAGKKILGINDSNGDTFDVTEIKVWIPE